MLVTVRLSAIDVRQNSFKVDAEVTVFRQMLSCELRLWLADQERFSDKDVKVHIGFTPKCKEIILLNKEVYADGKPFQVLWLGFGVFCCHSLAMRACDCMNVWFSKRPMFLDHHAVPTECRIH